MILTGTNLRFCLNTVKYSLGSGDCTFSYIAQSMWSFLLQDQKPSRHGPEQPTQDIPA